MKILRIGLKILLTVIIVLLIFVISIVQLENYRTSYLNHSKIPNSHINSYLIKNTHVIPMTKDTVLHDHDVLVKDGKIVRIAKSIYHEDIEIINGENQYLLPGLIDMHVHVWDKQELGLYLANGVTAVRSLWGLPFHLKLKEQINNKEIITPIFFASSPKLTGKDDLGDDKVQVDSPEQARVLVKWYKKRGYDFIKTYAGMTEAEYIAIVEEAENLDIDVVAHPSFKVDYIEQFHPQIATIEHTEDIYQQALNYQLDSVKALEVAKKMAERNQIFSPTLTGFYKIYEMLENENILNSEDASYMNPLLFDVDSKNQVSRWRNEQDTHPETINRIKTQHSFHLYLINLLHTSGVKLVASTDAGIGFTVAGKSILEELQLYSQAGLNNYEVLKTATVNPSETHKIMNDLGTISSDKKANLLLLKQNPLENLDALKQTSWVMVNGIKLNQDILNEFKQKAKSRKTKLITGLRYINYLWTER